NPVPIIEMYKLHEVQRYLTLDGHIYSPQFILINEKFYQSLPPEDQYIFADSARIAAAFHRGLRAWAQATGIERLQAHGMEVYAPTMDEIRAFREVAQPAAIEYVESQIGKEWVNKILKAVEEAEQRQREEI
ncbi:MAG: C4-dicarboxylate ABC transporter substrate-binding protein, partial [Firmicutes bacterium]|nr:C4-dicarboxylate ABC transporter substrate-binding protein [Bacillota bacterium]